MPHPVAQGLAHPEALAVTRDGNGLLVLEGGAGRLIYLDLATSDTQVIADGLALSGALPRNVLGRGEPFRPARGPQ